MSTSQNVTLTPPPFADGLGVWSREDGTPGTATYDGATDAAFVPADQDFAGCLELLKTQSTQRLRYMGETPVRIGHYIKVTARVKAVSGALPSVRIAGWAGRANGTHVGGLVETGPSVQLTTYGEVVTVEAIIGSGARDGVDMVWGTEAVCGHFGIDLTGPNGGAVRVDDLQITDVTGNYARDFLDWVDVRDYGAVGDGITDDSAAFEAADADANGSQIVVPGGLYFLGNSVTFENAVRFEGRVVMATEHRLALRKNYNLNSYIDAFGDEELAFKKAFQALLNYTDHEMLDLNGRQVTITEPIDMQAAVDNRTAFHTRRVIQNGTLDVQNSAAWTPTVINASANYSPGNPLRLTNVANIANIEIGSLVEGTGVGREVYVRSKNVAAGEITLSQQLWGAPASQTYTFTRFKYVLDFSGFSGLSKMVLSEMNIQCNGYASAVMLSPSGTLNGFNEMFITKPSHRAITSIGSGCQGLQIDSCRFASNESPLQVPQRSSICFNVNAHDLKLRNSWFQHFKHTGVLHGTGHLITGNHWFQGDAAQTPNRTPGMIFTGKNVKSVITGNYIDNNWIEMTNEHDAAPSFSNEFSFGGLTVTGNIFTSSGTGTTFRWIKIRPYGSGHFIQGLSVTGNTFRALSGNIGRIEDVDTSIATLDFGRFRNIVFSANTFNNVNQTTFNPVTLEFNQGSNQSNWVLNFGGYLPFGGYLRTVDSVVTQGPIYNSGNTLNWSMPYVTTRYGSSQNQARLSFSSACRGKVVVTGRVDNPT